MEWNAIDLHMHTVEGVTRDKKSDQINFSYEMFVKVLIKYKIKLAAVTNHNKVDMANFILLKYLANKIDTNILLGAEIDTITDREKPLHIVLISKINFNDNMKMAKQINELTSEKQINDEFIIFDSNEIMSLIRQYDSIIIPHGEKSQGIFKDATEENIKEALKKIKEGFIKIFDSPSNWKLEKIKQYLFSIGEENLDQFGGVLFSDVRDWEKYDERFRNFNMNAEPTFNGLLHSITNPTKRFKPFKNIISNGNYISKIKFIPINEKNRIEPKTIHFSSGFNCIIGKSGSGKSLLLNLIKRELIPTEEVSEKYRFTDNTKVEIYNEENVLLDSTLINVGIGDNLYDKIINANISKDNDDIYYVIELINEDFKRREKFTKKLNEYKDKVKHYYLLTQSTKEKEIKLVEQLTQLSEKINQKNGLSDIEIFSINVAEKNELTYSQEYIEEYNTYHNKINELRKLLKDCKESQKDEILLLLDILEGKYRILKNKMLYRTSLEILKNLKITIIEDAISNINGTLSKKALQKSTLNTKIPVLIKNIVSNLKKNYIIKLTMNEYDLSLDPNDINSEHLVNIKHNIIIKEELPIDITNLNIRDNLFFRLHGMKQKLVEKMYDLTDQSSAKELISKYIEVGVIAETREWIEEDFDVKVQILFNGQDVKELNPGNISKTYIEIYFEEQIKNGKNSVVIFDQIENDVDKQFISQELKELIESTKGHVQMIIVTHDPIVAVNADPTNYIESLKTKDKFIYRDFKAESELQDELMTIANNVDGSKNVIKNRYEIYGEE